MHYWQLQEAKARLSELVQLALRKGPQGISVRGKEEVIIISKKQYEKVMGVKPDFLTFLSHSPLQGLLLHTERDPSPSREIDL
jgi:antitoxin Phd